MIGWRRSRASRANAAIAVSPWSLNADSMWHWAHLKSKACDPWWEPETEWHRSWKDQFPVAWQEIGHTAQSGERHRADVKTESGLVLEFQYSPLSDAERVSREEFYTRLVWVVHANRRRRDRKKFFFSLSGPLNPAAWSLGTFSIHRDDSALLRDWGKSRAPVYFDFGETEQGESPLWRLYPLSDSMLAYLTPVVRAEFVRHIAMGRNSKRCSIMSSLATASLPLPEPQVGHRFRVFPGIRHEECDASKRSRRQVPLLADIVAKVFLHC
jgi:hypothetical protein